MAYIKTITEKDLKTQVDPLVNKDVYPVTSTQAIYSQNANGAAPSGVKHKLEDRLKDHEADAKILHGQTEKLTPELDTKVYKVNVGTRTRVYSPVEIDGIETIVELTGSAEIETFGDATNKTVKPGEMTEYELFVTHNDVKTIIESSVSGNDIIGTYTFPNEVGTYTFEFECYYGAIKQAYSAISLNLRKYFGFAADDFADDLTRVDVTSLNVEHFSNSVACTVEITHIDAGNKYIYFAVPINMTIQEVTQASTGYQLYITEITNENEYAERTIGSSSYDYRIYRSTIKIDSSNNVTLNIK